MVLNIYFFCQAETEELALKVDNLVSENAALKSELVRLTELSENLRQENYALMVHLIFTFIHHLSRFTTRNFLLIFVVTGEIRIFD